MTDATASDLRRARATCAGLAALVALGLGCSGEALSAQTEDPADPAARADGGTQAATGAHDAGSTVDAGLPAEPPDAGAGQPDAGQPDAGAAQADAGVLAPDAGVSTPGWPTCDGPEPGATQQTLHGIWQANPAVPTPFWVPGAFVTGVSRGGCQTGFTCQLFLQQAETFADLASGSQQALKLLVSADTAVHFLGVKAGDEVDVDAYGARDTRGGRNELLLAVDPTHPGCAKVVGQGSPQPVAVVLTDLTVAAYEETMGPLLVTVATVSGKPGLPVETFGLWKTGTYTNADPTTLTSLSPYFLPNAAFTTLTQAKVHDFGSVTGVFGLFSPTADPTKKYEELYPRVETELPILRVH